MTRKIAFIGCGNIASAMIKGIVRSGVLKADHLMASDKNENKLTSIKNELNINTTTDNIEAAQWGDIIFLCVEPKMSKIVIEEIKNTIDQSKIVVSVAAGINLSDLTEWFNNEARIVRIMPNIPILVGEGLTMICETDNVDEQEMAYLKDIITSFGKAEVLNEKYMNAFIALASSSPAFIYIMIEAMADAAVAMGLHRDMSYKIVAQAVYGSAKMVLDTGKHPGELKDMVCSPAGTTIDAIASLEETGFRHSILKALKVGEEKCNRISKG